MTKQRAENAVRKLNDNGIEASVYVGYSGRGMGGATTYGVDLASGHDMTKAMRLCRTLGRWDRMGLGIIFY